MSVSTAPTGMGPPDRRENASVVRTVDLSKRIDERAILRAVNLDIPPGRSVALLGVNGAGKSTLLKILATLIPPTAGQLHLFGQSARHHAARLRSRIGLIGHQPMLYRDLTARENLLFFGRLYGLERPGQRAEELLELVGLADRADDPIKAFSRGMAQRTAIARALMHRPELLLADEPFAGLDVPSARTLEQLLARLHADDKTILMSDHDVRHSLTIAEQIIVLRSGQVALDRPAAQLDYETTVREMTAA